MVVPRVERRGAAGLVTTTADRDGMTPDRGEPVPRRRPYRARTPASRSPSASAPTRCTTSTSSWTRGSRPTGCSSAASTARTPPAPPLEVAGRGAFVGIDHVGLNDDADYLTDRDRAELVLELVGAGHADRIILSGNSIGVAKGQPDYDLPYSHVAVHVRAFPQGAGPERRGRPAHPRGQPAQPADRALSTRRPTPTSFRTPEVRRMTKVNTVLGTIPAEELEIVAVHEHIGYGMPGSELDTTVVEDPGAGLRGDRAEAAEVPRVRRRAPSWTPRASATAATSTTTSPCPRRPACTSWPAPASSAATPPCRTSPAPASTTSRKVFIHEITVGIGDTGSQGRRHQGRREPRRTDDGPGQAHLPRRGPRRRRHRRADPDPPGHRRRTGGEHLQRRGPPAGPRALRPRRRRPERSGHPARLDLRAGRPHRLRHLRLRPRAAGSAVLGPPARANAWSTSSASWTRAMWTSSSSRPTPIAARWAGRA